MVEYILVVVLVGIVLITAVRKFSTKTKKGFDKASTELSQVFGN